MTHKITTKIAEVIREIVPEGKVQLHEPIFEGREIEYLTDCIKTGFVSSVGQYVTKFEKEMCDITGATYAIALVNGTCALQLALRVSGVIENDEVILPTLTFVAGASAIRSLGAWPCFADSETKTLGICSTSIRDWLKNNTKRNSKNELINSNTDRRISAIMPVHIFGHPCNISDLSHLANEYGLALIEDAAEGLGSTYRGRHLGTFGNCGIISFNGNKTVTAGGGGVLLTNNRDVALHCKHLSTTAKVSHKWDYIHDQFGYNFRMPNVNAAIALAQLENLPKLLQRKRNLFKYYDEKLGGFEGCTILNEPSLSKSNFWLQNLLLPDTECKGRDQILDELTSLGIMVRPIWKLLHELEPYKDCPRMTIDVAPNLRKRIISLPSNFGDF